MLRNLVIRTAEGRSAGPVLVALAVVFAILPASADHGSVFRNAVDKKDIANYGSYAVIEGTDPDLHGGLWSYHRVAVVQWSPWRFGEIGWWKKSNGEFKGLIVWDDGSRHSIEFAYSPGSDHSFSNQWDPNNARYDWFYDGTWIASADLGFSQADAVSCGGEVASGVESMGNTRCGNWNGNGLLYQVPNGSGGWKYEPWNGYVPYVEDPPYQVINIDNNNFRASGNE